MNMKLSGIQCICILLVMLFLCSCNSQNIETSSVDETFSVSYLPTQEEMDCQIISLLLMEGEKEPFWGVTSDELEGIYDGSISYPANTDVYMTIDGITLPLKEALVNRSISIEDFIAGVRTDARNGYCKEIYESQLGLTSFTYRYRNCEISFFDDVWEAPNGELILVREIHIDKPRDFDNGGINRWYTDSEGNQIDYRREDWGLSFETMMVTPTGVDVTVTQYGGQQLGALQIARVSALYQCSSNEWFEGYKTTIIPADGFVVMGGVSEFSFNWSENLGELPSGEYYLYLDIDDLFNPNQIHPHLKDYADHQLYQIQFTIP